jgi:hypothetical protein
MKQPSLFNFKPTDKLRNSTFTPEEERALVGFCLSDNYPRQHTVKRTGTTYKLKTALGARALLKALRYGDAGTRTAITSPNQLLLR